ncbi:small ribosomal subunit protein mS33-like [Antedon mediterranea]|uniref:small ribosomal subunit protein mS33-like n=1 Tax=Antedon mediterranea TaxID=105859 RepID=UPI003AF8594C
MASNYAKRMARLSSRVFGQLVRPTNPTSMRVVNNLSREPIEQQKYYVDYYPPHVEIARLMYRLRHFGLYRDEHADFKDEMKRVAKLRGKGKPKKGEGKRALKRK